MTVIKIKKSNVAGKVPAVSDLEIAELAINLQDKKLYTKDATGSIVSIGGSVSSGPDTDKPPSPSPGDLFYDDTTDELQFWNGTAWESIVSTDGSGSVTLALAQLSDVAVVGVTDGQVLGYQTDEWIPVNLPVVNNSTVTINDSSGTQVGLFTVNQAADSTIALPAPPVVNDSAVTINASDGSEVGSFTVNQDADSTIVLPAPPVVPLSVSDSTPTSPNHGDMWVDTAVCPPELKVYADISVCPAEAGWNAIKGGGGGGGTAVDFPPSALPGGSLTLQPAELSSASSKIEFSTDGASWFSSIGPTTPADVVQARWTIDAHDSTPDGGTTIDSITYEIIGGATYNESYEYNVTKTPDPIDFADVSDTLLNAVTESPTNVIVSGITARCRAWCELTNATNPEIYCDGYWKSLPTSVGDTVLIDPNSEIKLRHTTSTNILEECSTKIYLGWDATDNVSDVFTTTNVNAGVDTPNITNISDGEIDVGLNLTIQSSPFVGIGPVDTHVSTDWQLATDAGFTSIVSQSMGDTTNKTSWTPGFSHDTQFWLRVRYNGSSPLVASSWSPVINFTSIDAYIEAPTINTPVQNGVVDQNGIYVVTSAPAGIEFGTHNASSWQISKEESFGTIYSESLNDAVNLTSWTSPAETETENETYYIRVQYYTDLGFSSGWSDVRTCTGTKMYSWRLITLSGGARAAHNWWPSGEGEGCGQGGSGRSVTSTCETSSTAVSAPGTLNQAATFATGGAGSGDSHGPGGASAASTLDGVRISVGAGGGGGSGNDNGNGGRANDDPKDGSATPNPGNGQDGPGGEYKVGAGGAGGIAGLRGQTRNSGGQGGTGYMLSVGDQINDWTFTEIRPDYTSGNNSPNQTSCSLWRKYKDGGWTSVGSKGNNYNGSVANIATTFFLDLEKPFDIDYVRDQLVKNGRMEMAVFTNAFRAIEFSTTGDDIVSDDDLVSLPVQDVAGALASYYVHRNLQINNVSDRSAFCVNGYYPLHLTEQQAKDAGNGTVVTHVIYGRSYYMPNGVDQWLGNYYG